VLKPAVRPSETQFAGEAGFVFWLYRHQGMVVYALL